MIVLGLAADDQGLITIVDGNGHSHLSTTFDINLHAFEEIKEAAVQICEINKIDPRISMDPRLKSRLTEPRYTTLEQEGLLEQFI